MSYTCTLSKELQEIAKTELNENPETRDKDIQALLHRVLTNKALNCPRDGAFLVRFLRARKFDLEKSYQLLVNYYYWRAKNKVHLKTLMPNSCIQLIDSGLCTLLPSLDKQGRRIVYIRYARWNPDETKMIDFLRLNVICREQLIREELTQVKGIVSIVNMAGLDRRHYRKRDQRSEINSLKLSKEAFPLRIEALHFVNEPFGYSFFIALVKPFMNKDIQVWKFHRRSLESLHRFFDTSVLPTDLGGSLEMDVLEEKWKNELYASQKYFEDMSEYHMNLENDGISSQRSHACIIL